VGFVRRLVRIVVVLVVIALAAVTGLVGAITLRALPTTTGGLAVKGLVAPVDVTRDAAGIVRISAESPHDLFLAQGYVHAQERLWQMEVWRHISAGRLSELFGKTTLDQDRFIRTLGWRQAAQRDLDTLSTGARAAVDAYAAGVNAYLDSHRGNLGLGFVVTGLRTGAGGFGGYYPEPWTALDTMAWQKVQSWQLGGNFNTEVFRMLADAKLGDPALTDQLFPAYGADMPVITPSGLPGSGGAGVSVPRGIAAASAGATPNAVSTRPVVRRSQRTAGSAPASPTIGPDAASAWRDVAGLGGRILALAGLDAADGIAGDHEIGSNDWVVAGARSASGGALLANDPHLGIGMPSVWFMNELRCRKISSACPYDVAGVSFPGVPGIVLGHNARIAWGATNTDPDVEDLFVEKVDPANPANYIFKGQSIPFTVRHETIKVAGAADVVIDVRGTGHGPILNDVDKRLANAPPLALRWTATAEADGTFETIFRLQTAGSFDEFRAAFKTYGAPAQNFVYADVDGHIGYVFPGYVPIRADKNDRGARVRSGTDGKHEWVGRISVADLPWQLDPTSGVIVSANNAAVDASYPHFVAAEWDPGFRAKRILELLANGHGAGGKVTNQDMQAIQMDDRVLRADLVIPHLESATPTTADGRLLRDRVLAWDRRASLDSDGAAAYLVTEYRLLRGLFDDELGSLAREYVGGGASWQALIAMLDDPTSVWWDDTTTADRVEAEADIMSAALDRAAADLKAALGDDPKTWTWGRLHQATFREATLGESGIAPLEWYFDKGPYAAPGAAGAVNNTYYRPSRAYPDPNDPSYVPASLLGIFEVTNLPSYRLTIDMSDVDGARIVQTTGQSGNPFDSHYGDLIGTWLAGGTVALPFSPEVIDSSVAQRLTLVP
jgi:penicillin amidase